MISSSSCSPSWKSGVSFCSMRIDSNRVGDDRIVATGARVLPPLLLLLLVGAISTAVRGVASGQVLGRGMFWAAPVDDGCCALDGRMYDEYWRNVLRDRRGRNASSDPRVAVHVSPYPRKALVAEPQEPNLGEPKRRRWAACGVVGEVGITMAFA